jgi:PAS domain S-box-containing protein
MTKSIRVLMVEDSENDAFLLIRELQRGGYDPIYQRVDTADSMEAALANHQWDIVLADQKMPTFSGLEALDLLKRKQIDLPFILVSGTTPEETAATAIKAGAHDFVLKNMLARLVPALERGLKEAELRRARKSALAALEDSEERYRRLVEMCPDAILITRNEQIAFINGAGLKLLNPSDQQQVLGKSIVEFLHPDGQEHVKHKLQEALNSKEALSAGEQRIRRADGTLVEVEMVAAPFPDNNALTVQIVLRDITERKQAAERLQASEERFRQLAENIREVFWMTDASKNQMLYVSPAYEQIWGRSCENLYKAPRDWMEAIHSDDVERVCQAALTKQAAGEYDEVYRIVRPDGSVRWIEDRAFPIRSGAGQVYRIAGIAQDITTRTQATEALRESEERFRSLFESAPIGIALHGADGKFIQTNAAYQRILGYSDEELLRLGVKRVTHPDDVDEGKRLFQELCSGKLDFYQRQKRYLGKGDRVVWAQVAASAVRNPDGQLRYIISMVQDVTMQKRMGDRSAAFARLAHQLSAATTPLEAAQVIMDLAAELFGWDACYLHLYSAERNLILPILTLDTVGGRRVQVPPDSFTLNPSPLMLEVMKTGPRLVHRDQSASGSESELPLIPFGDVARRSASMMYVPIRHGPKIIGILSIQSYAVRAYNDEDLHTLHSLADHCGAALERIHTAATLRQNEWNNRILLDAVPHCLFRIGQDGTILDYRAPKSFAAQLAGLQLPGKRLDEICPLPLVEEFMQHRYRALKTGEPQTFEFKHALEARRDAFEAQVAPCGEAEVLVVISDITDRKRLEKEILEISERERQRLGQDLHDSLCQNLIGLKYKAALLQRKLQEKVLTDESDAKGFVKLLDQAIMEAHHLAQGLYPVKVEADGLMCALEELASNTASVFNTSCRCCFPNPVLIHDSTAAIHLYRIAQEAVSNAIKHGQARNILIFLRSQPSQIVLTITDNGLGLPCQTQRKNGMGLNIMKYRAQMIGGSVDIHRRARVGTRVRCFLPVRRQDPLK